MTTPNPATPSCVNACAEAASVRFQWLTTGGPQSVLFCAACAAQWWAQWSGTPAGDSLQILPVPTDATGTYLCRNTTTGEITIEPFQVTP